MTVTVKYFAQMRERVRKDEEMVILEEGSRLKDLVQLLMNRYRLEEALISNCLITVNERGASQLLGSETELRSGDRVCFMPVLAGG